MNELNIICSGLIVFVVCAIVLYLNRRNKHKHTLKEYLKDRKKVRLTDLQKKEVPNCNCRNCGGNIAFDEKKILRCVFCGTIYNKTEEPESIFKETKEKTPLDLKKIALYVCVGVAILPMMMFLTRHAKTKGTWRL